MEFGLRRGSSLSPVTPILQTAHTRRSNSTSKLPSIRYPTLPVLSGHESIPTYREWKFKALATLDLFDSLNPNLHPQQAFKLKLNYLASHTTRTAFALLYRGGEASLQPRLKVDSVEGVFKILDGHFKPGFNWKEWILWTIAMLILWYSWTRGVPALVGVLASLLWGVFMDKVESQSAPVIPGVRRRRLGPFRFIHGGDVDWTYNWSFNLF